MVALLAEERDEGISIERHYARPPLDARACRLQPALEHPREAIQVLVVAGRGDVEVTGIQIDAVQQRCRIGVF